MVNQLTRWRQAPADVAIAFYNGWLDYARTAVGADKQRPASANGFFESLSPLSFWEDAAEWLRASTVRSRPEWSTGYRETATWPEARLLDFSVGTSGVPVLFLPPQAGHASTIVDYRPDQSQIRTALANGLDRVYSFDWLPATPATKASSIERYIEIMDAALERLGGRAHLVGDCQGGWLSVIYAALRPDSVASLIVGGAPIDFHGGQSAIQEWTRLLSRRGRTDFYRAVVALGGGNYRGANQVQGFKMLQPAEEYTRLAGLWGNIRDPAYVQRHIDFTNWFEWDQDLPGAFYLWIVEQLFIGNKLINKQLNVGGELVDLARITMPVHMLAGTADHITPAPQMFALADHISTSADEISKTLVEAGHLGLFMGRVALQEAWAPLFARTAAADSAQEV